jgi:inner membrane protein involved in colicin E2 resistance
VPAALSLALFLVIVEVVLGNVAHWLQSPIHYLSLLLMIVFLLS